MNLTDKQRLALSRLPSSSSLYSHMTGNHIETRVCNALVRLGLAEKFGSWCYRRTPLGDKEAANGSLAQRQ